ncbi:MAG: tetratricopeptide repeat protein [Bacteroidales bacterium]|nr:tetratricopeptide repeat protein [Bacteroidales bacterium]
MKRVLYILLTFLFVFGGVAPAGAQVDRRDVRKGNRDFKKENYREAEIDYRKALVKDSLSLAANYNLANTLYKEGNHDLAGKCLETVKEIAPASASASDYYFNLGDVAIARQDWQGAVDAFKESLLRNPGDLQAKENYIYAKKKLEDQQNQQDQNQDQQNDQNQNDQNQNQDQNDQNQNQDQNDQNKDRQNDQQNQNNDQNQDKQNDQDRQNQQGQQSKISPQAAQQMLQAIQAKEKETQEKVNKQKAEALKSRQKEKNW